ncbi:unnamed protein product [Heterobilharzia americana]|nr:unnamed protein product [Heterobilharzia americana]
MDLIQKLIRRAISSIELKKSIKQIDGEESCPSEMSAFIFRNSSTEMNLPIALRSFLPETEVTIGNKEMNSWKKIYAEEVVNIIKLPRFPTEQAITRETIHQSQESTIFLCSDHIVLTQWPLDPQSFLSTGDLAHIIPLYEVWCDTLKPEALFSRSTSVTKSTGINKGSHSQKHMKTSEIDIDNAKCNVSSSSGISTASLEDAESNSPSIDNNQSLDNEIKIRVTESSSTNETSVSTDTSLLLLVGRPLTENWAIRFSNNSLCEKWEHMINESIKRNQQIFEGKTINVKVINQIIPNHQVIYKYHNVPIHMTANHLKEKALEALNTNVGNTNAELFLRYTESNGEEREILMYGPEIPFLIAFSSVQMNHTSSPLFQQNNSVTATTTTVISSNSNPNSPDASYSPQGKDILDLMKKVSSTSPQSDVRINDSDYIIPRDQVKVSFVLRPREKSSTEDHQTHQTVKSDDITTKPVEYTKQERGRSKSKARGRRGGVGGGGGDHTGDKQNSLMTKSSLFLDNSMSTSKQTSLPLRAAISTSALQINTAQDTQCGQIFGCLPEQVWPDSQLPESLVNLFAIVYYNGVDIEGIFRRTAVHSQIELMRARVDENIQAITPNNCNPILASCVLKRFFYEIPGHLLIDSKWDEWASLTGINSSTERLQLIEKLVRSLPKVNQTLLALLIYLLAHIRDNEETNRMSARNLAVVWGPNLIQRPNSPLALSDSKIATQIVTYLLEPPVTNFLLETSNARNELNQHFTNIWGNLKGTTGISHTAKTVGNTKMFSAITGTDSSEDDKSSKVDSGVQSEQRTEDSTHKSLKTDTEIKHPSRRGHSVASVPPHISPLESDNLLNSEKFYSPLLKGHDLHESTANTSTVSIDSRSSLSLTSSLSNSSVMTRRGVGRINRKKQSMLSQLALPDQTGPPVAIKQTTSSSDATTSDLRGIKRVRATSTVVQPTSSSPMAMTTTTTTAVATVAEAIGKLKRTSVLHRSRNTSCPPSRDTGQQKMSTPYPLPKYQVDLEAPPVPPKLQQSMQLTYQGVRCKQASIATNANSLKANQNHQIKFTKNSQYSEREPSPPVPKKTFHRRFRLQKTTSEIPDVSLFTDSCYTKEMKSNNSNTYRRRNSMESQMNNSRLPNETISNELSINSTKTDESSAPIKIISVSSSSNNHNNVGDNNKENISHRSHRHSYAHSIGDNPGGNNLTAKYTKLLQASTDHRTRNSIPQSESDMSVTSTDSSSLSFSSSSLSSLRKHSRRKETDLSGIPSPVVHRPEFSKQGFIVNPQRKSSCIIHRMISPQQFGVYKNVDSQAEQYATGLPSFASSSLSSSSSPTSFSSSDIGYATSQHENQESIVEIDSIAYGTPVSRMSSHASTISSGSATVISTSTEK